MLGQPEHYPTTVGWHLQQTRTVDAWKHTRGDGAVICTVDDGLDVYHPEFEGRVVAPFNAATGRNDACPEGWAPHGTKVAARDANATSHFLQDQSPDSPSSQRPAREQARKASGSSR